MFDDLSDSQLYALRELGKELDEIDWAPKVPITYSFGGRPPDDETGWIKLAIAYVLEHREELQNKVCEAGAVRPELLAAGATVATVVDALQASGGFPVPVWNLANILCQLGLSKFCSIKK